MKSFVNMKGECLNVKRKWFLLTNNLVQFTNLCEYLMLFKTDKCVFSPVLMLLLYSMFYMLFLF